MKIGFFDSGIGGISVLYHALKSLPQEEFLYYADGDHVPFGGKTREEICSYTYDGLKFLFDHGVDVAVVACNTATSAAIEYVRASFDKPILGMEPAVKPAVQHAAGKRVLVTATPFTIREERLHHLVRLVDKEHLVTLKALPELVNFAERGEFDSPAVRDYFLKEFSDLDLEDYGELVLGCTHFTYFRKVLSSILGPDVELIDGNQGTVRHLVELVQDLPTAGHRSVRFFISGRPVTDEKTLKFYQALMDQAEI